MLSLSLIPLKLREKQREAQRTIEILQFFTLFLGVKMLIRKGVNIQSPQTLWVTLLGRQREIQQAFYK